MLAVYPDVRERDAERRFRLRDFVFMMRADMIDAAGMDVERLAEEMARDRGALDVPAGEAFAPGRRPMKQMIFEFSGQLEPEREIGGVMLFIIDNYFASRADQFFFKRLAG